MVLGSLHCCYEPMERQNIMEVTGTGEAAALTAEEKGQGDFKRHPEVYFFQLGSAFFSYELINGTKSLTKLPYTHSSIISQ